MGQGVRKERGGEQEVAALARGAQPASGGPRLAVVAIGRNEGERLARCLDSVLGAGRLVVYVDSGSSDGSRELARARGAEVVELDLALPFTAARARNAGFERALELAPELTWVQFLDGDCALDPRWIETGLAALRAEERTAIVCGRRRELRPKDSVYNRLCDMEWDTPLGLGTDCGGDALVRAEAFRAVGGFDPGLIAGEEPDLCLRLRERGWQVRRIGAEMTLHDAAILRFAQWWKRALRNGHTNAERLAMLGPRRGPYFLRSALSALVYAIALPLAALGLALAPLSGAPRGLALLAPALLALYPLLFLRIARARERRGEGARAAREYAFFCILGKLPESLGMARYAWNRLRGRRTALIEYKGAPERGRA